LCPPHPPTSTTNEGIIIEKKPEWEYYFIYVIGNFFSEYSYIENIYRLRENIKFKIQKKILT